MTRLDASTGLDLLRWISRSYRSAREGVVRVARATVDLSWAPLFAVLVASATAKLVLRGGSIPRILDALPGGGRILLWIATAAELGIAALLWFPKYRSVGARAAALLLGCYALITLKSTDDAAFLTDCPCFGGAHPLPGRLGVDEIVYHIGVLALLISGALWASARRVWSVTFLASVGAVLLIAAEEIGATRTTQFYEEIVRMKSFLSGPSSDDEAASRIEVEPLDGSGRIPLASVVERLKPEFVVFLGAGCAACHHSVRLWGAAGVVDDARRIYVILGDGPAVRAFVDAGHLPPQRCFGGTTAEACAMIGVLGIPNALRCIGGRIVDPRRRATLLGAYQLPDAMDGTGTRGTALDRLRDVVGADRITASRQLPDLLVAEVIIGGEPARAAWVVGRDVGIPRAEIIILFARDGTISRITPIAVDLLPLMDRDDVFPLWVLSGRSPEEAARMVEDWQLGGDPGGYRALSAALLRSRAANGKLR